MLCSTDSDRAVLNCVGGSMMKLVALIGVISLASSTANADCAMIGLTAKVATPAKTGLTGGGGFLVHAVAKNGGKLASGDVALQTKWTLAGGKTPKKALLAPGLAVYQVTVTDQVTPI